MIKFCTFLLHVFTWVKVFRIIPEFRVLRLTFHNFSQPKMLNLADLNSFSDLFSVHLRGIDHLNEQLFKALCRHTASIEN